MSGSDAGTPVMISSPESPSAEAFRSSAKNIAAQCSILAARLRQEEQEAGAGDGKDGGAGAAAEDQARTPPAPENANTPQK